jgi:hypothetical protein
VEEPDRPRMTIRRMRFECRITKATNTHSEYVTILVFLQQDMVARMLLSVTLYVHCLFCKVCEFIAR